MKYHKPLQPTTPLPSIDVYYRPVVPVDHIQVEIIMSNRPIDHFNAEESARILMAKQKIQEKLNEFNMTIRKLGSMHEHSYFLTGGAIGSLLRGEEPNDWDIYFFDEQDAEGIFRLYEKDPSYENEVAVLDEKYRDVENGGKLITENATTLKNGIQLIRKHYGQPGTIRKTFDFVHCMPYYDSRDKKLYISPEQYDCNVNKKLVRNNNNLFQPHREDKFLKRGWTWL